MRVRSMCLWMAALYTVLAGGAGYTRGASVLEVPSTTPSEMTELRQVVLPEAPLRGYGTVGGEFVEYQLSDDQGVASVLRVACTDAAKAGIALGKYRSDLRSLGGVTERSVKFQAQSNRQCCGDSGGQEPALGG